MERILVVAESKETQQDVNSLLNLRYNLVPAISANEARQRLCEENYDLILISTCLTDLDGFRLCAMLRNHEKSQLLPIILIDSAGNPHSRTMAFSVGANDLVRTPLNAMEFVAEIAAVLQYRKFITRTKKQSSWGPFSVELEAQRVYLMENSTQRDLNFTPIEFKLFVLLTNHEGQPLSREKIRTSIWGKSVHIESRSIDKHISSLRRKISPHEECLQTAPGLGYSLAFRDKNSIKDQAL